jgi:hypothetical protein
MNNTNIKSKDYKKGKKLEVEGMKDSPVFTVCVKNVSNLEI